MAKVSKEIYYRAKQKFDIPNKNFKNDIGIFKEIEHSIDNHQ